MMKSIYITMILFLLPTILWCDINQYVSGDKSNNFNNVTGNISINYNYDRDKPKGIKDAIKLIEKIVTDGISEIYETKWLTLSGQDVLFITYRLESYKNNKDLEIATSFSDFFILNNDTAIRIYHQPAYESDEIEKILVGKYDNTDYIFLYSNMGSGYYLSGVLYRLNELNQLVKEYVLSGGYAGSQAYSMNNKIIVNQMGRISILKKDNDKFFLENFKNKIKYPDLGSSKHILRIVDCNKKIFEFDNTVLKPSNINIISYSKVDKKISLNEDIVILSNESLYKTLITDNLQQTNNIQTELRTIKKGDASITFLCSAGNDHDAGVEFLIK